MLSTRCSWDIMKHGGQTRSAEAWRRGWNLPGPEVVWKMTSEPGGVAMKPIFIIGAAVVAIVGVAAIAFAATGSDDGDAAQATSATATSTATLTPAREPPTATATQPPTATATPTHTPEPTATQPPALEPSSTPQPPTPSPEPQVQVPALPTAPGGPDSPVVATPQPTVGPNTPIPSEPIFTVTPANPPPSLSSDRYAEFAPIDGLDIAVAESFPPQYFVHILAGLPSGCAEQYTHSFTRTGNRIEVEVLNSLPTGAMACTAIYGIYELNIALGSDFSPGETYTVSVNDGAATTEFVAQ